MARRSRGAAALDLSPAATGRQAKPLAHVVDGLLCCEGCGGCDNDEHCGGCRCCPVPVEPGKPLRYVHRAADRPGLMRVYRQPDPEAGTKPELETGSFSVLGRWCRAKGVAAQFVTSPSSIDDAVNEQPKGNKTMSKTTTVPEVGERAYKLHESGKGWSEIAETLKCKAREARRGAVLYAAAHGKPDPVNRRSEKSKARVDGLRGMLGGGKPVAARKAEPAKKAPAAKKATAKVPGDARGVVAASKAKAASASTAKGRKQAVKAAVKEAPKSGTADGHGNGARRGRAVAGGTASGDRHPQVTPLPKKADAKSTAREAAVAAAE